MRFKRFGTEKAFSQRCLQEFVARVTVVAMHIMAWLWPGSESGTLLTYINDQLFNMFYRVSGGPSVLLGTTVW